MNRRVMLEMLGFGCPSCAFAIERMAGRLEGVVAVKVDIGARRIVVDCEDKGDPVPAIQAFVHQLGHETRLLSVDQADRQASV